MDKEHLAIASVPDQKWGSLFSDEQALKTGTIFEDLDMPFYVTEGGMKSEVLPGLQTGESQLSSVFMKTKEEEERDQMLKKICEVSFVLDDLALYLDVHPEDEAALRVFREKNSRRGELKKEFAERFYPLTRDCMTFSLGVEGKFSWQTAPCPWEGGCI